MLRELLLSCHRHRLHPHVAAGRGAALLQPGDDAAGAGGGARALGGHAHGGPAAARARRQARAQHRQPLPGACVRVVTSRCTGRGLQREPVTHVLVLYCSLTRTRHVIVFCYVTNST